MIIEMTYMSGAGNLFTVINSDVLKTGPDQYAKLAQLLCPESEYNDFVTEGLLCIGSSDENDFDALFFNPDGSSGMMCGNGGRCAVRYAIENGIAGNANMKSQLQFGMAGQLYKAEVADNSYRLFFPPPNEIKTGLELTVDNLPILFDFVNIGSDHVVIFFDELQAGIPFESAELMEIARKIRHHHTFDPVGANVNIYRLENGLVRLRTYERGVEAETGACGTGAISTALAAVLRFSLPIPVKLIPPSGSKLVVNIIGDLPDEINEISLEGYAEFLNSRSVEIPDDIILGKESV